MIMRKCCVVLIATAVSLCSVATYGLYETHLLESIASKLSLKNQLDSIATQANSDTVIYAPRLSQHLHIKTNNCSEISHIGYSIFSRDSSQFIPNEVCDFVERYVLQLDLLPHQFDRTLQMTLNNVLSVGNPHDFLNQIGETDTLRYGQLQHHTHAVSIFRKAGSTQLTFDADCQLMLGADDPELEDIFARRFRKFVEQCDSAEHNFMLRLDKYNYQCDTIMCNRQDIVEMCENDGCKVSVATKPDGGEVLFAINPVLAYVHVMSITGNVGRLYTYIKLHTAPDDFIEKFYNKHNFSDKN